MAVGPPKRKPDLFRATDGGTEKRRAVLALGLALLGTYPEACQKGRAPSSSGTHGMHLRRSWNTPWSGPGAHHPRAGKLEMHQDGPGTHH
eukprot:4749786-Pyramimonas_sp.AAC.1